MQCQNPGCAYEGANLCSKCWMIVEDFESPRGSGFWAELFGPNDKYQVFGCPACGAPFAVGRELPEGGHRIVRKKSGDHWEECWGGGKV